MLKQVNTPEKVYKPKFLNENEVHFQLKDGYSATARITKKGFFDIRYGEFYDKYDTRITEWMLGEFQRNVKITFDTDGSIHTMWSCEINTDDIDFLKTITSLIEQISDKIKNKDYTVGSFK